MRILVDNGKRKNRGVKENNGRIDKHRRMERGGIGIEFVKGMYELITREAPDPIEIEEILLVHGSRCQSLKNEKNIGILYYNENIKDFIETFKIPYKMEDDKILLFSDDTIREIYSRYFYSKEKGMKNNEKYTIGRFFEDIAILIGYPSCCSVCYGKFIDSGKSIIEHPFYSEAREKIVMHTRMPIKNVSAEEIREMILSEEIYPTSLLFTGRIIDGERMLPCSINCEKAIEMTKEWADLISRFDYFLFVSGLRGYDFEENIENINATTDAMRIKGIEIYKGIETTFRNLRKNLN